MSLSNQEIDSFIDAAINRLSTESGELVSRFYVDLRSYQKRITDNLVNQCISACEARGIAAERKDSGLILLVNLSTCFLNPVQANLYNKALLNTREVHGNVL